MLKGREGEGRYNQICLQDESEVEIEIIRVTCYYLYISKTP